ncbi:MAG: DUF3467 domain-containing protein [Acidobacteriia bacterium]|nr:DUF3467 domain-containing protein [Terriglobia bacterium]
MARKHREVATHAGVLDAPLVPKTVRRDRTKSPNFISLYVNDIELQTSTWDLRLKLGEISDVSIEGEVQVTQVNELAEVRMSPQLAKRLTIILIEQLRGYETAFGQIPGPPKE